VILVHLNKLRGVIAYVLGRTTVDDLGVADRERPRSHHRKSMCSAIVFDVLSECRIDILSCSLDHHEGGLLRVIRTNRIIILVISGVLSL
jgi:hypothetical protein